MTQTLTGKLFAASLGICILCLIAGTVSAGRWEGGLAAGILVLLRLVFLGRSTPWMPSLLLVLYTLAAAGGVLWEGDPLLLLLGIVAALVAWDLENVLFRLGSNPETSFLGNQQNKRLLLLAGVMGVSVVLISLGLLIRIHLPFGVGLLVAFAALVSISLLAQLLLKNAKS